MKIEKWIALSAALPTLTHCLYSSHSAVVQLTGTNFDELVVKHPALWVVEFFAPWCGHCKALAPEYEKAASKLKGLVKVGAVDCDVDANKGLCGAHGIRGFPTIKIFKNSAKGSKKFASDYQGERKSAAIVEHALSNLQSYLKVIVDEGASGIKDEKKEMPFDKFMQVGASLNLSHALFFSEKKTVANTLKALSSEFYRQMVIGIVDGKMNPKTAEMFKVKKFPTLIVLPVSVVDAPITYEGEMKPLALEGFLRKYAKPLSSSSSSSSNTKQQGGEKTREKDVKVEEPFDPKIHEVTSNSDFKQYCTDHSLGLCIVFLSNVEPAYPESLKAHAKSLDMVSNLWQSFYDKGDKLFRCSWMNPLKFPKIVKDLDLAQNFPTLLAINPRKNLYRPFLYGFEESNVERFLKELLQGTGRMFNFPAGSDFDIGKEIPLPEVVVEEQENDDEDEDDHGIPHGGDEEKEKVEL